MAVETQVVRFQKSTGADGTTQDVTLDFTPKAIILYSAGGTADASVEAQYQRVIGFSDGTNGSVQSLSSEDNSAAGDAARNIQTGYVWMRLSETVPTTTFQAYGTCAFITNGVRFTWTENDANATYITIWAIGGSDITSVQVDGALIGRTTVGPQDYTGLGFTPNGDGHTALFLLATNVVDSAIASTAIGSFGVATTAYHPHPGGDNLKQWYIGSTSEHASDPSDTWRVSGADRNMAVLSATGTFAHYCYLTNWLPDGFRLYWDGPPASSSTYIQFLVINGGNWDCGTLSSPTTATNDVDYTVAVDSKPIRGMFLAGGLNTVTASIASGEYYSLGATDGTNSSVIAGTDLDAQATTDTYRFSSTTSLAYTMITAGALFERATFDSFGTNSFRLDWPTKTATAYKYHWIVVADQTPSSTDRVLVYQGTFGKLSYNGTQTISGLPFQPKAIIFWSANMTGTSFLDGVSAMYGFTDGTTDTVVQTASEDNVATSDCITAISATICIALLNTDADTSAGTASLTSFDSYGFTLTWSGSTATTTTVHYMAIGGTDITNVKAGVTTVAKAVTGNKAYTGIGFQPDFLLTANNGQIKASAIGDSEFVDHYGVGISAMKSTTERWAISTASEGTRADSDTWRYNNTAKCFSLIDNSTGTLTGEADFISFDSDGFTWNYTTAGTNITNSKFIYLAIKGGVWDVATHAVPTTDSTVTTNTDATGTLKGVMFANIANNPNAGVETHNALMVGATDGTRQSVINYHDIDAAATMASARIQKTTNCTYALSANATAASSTSNWMGALSSFGTSSFAIAYTGTAGVTRTWPYFAVSELIVAAVLEQPSFKSFGTIGITNTYGNTIFG